MAVDLLAFLFVLALGFLLKGSAWKRIGVRGNLVSALCDPAVVNVLKCWQTASSITLW